MFRDGNMCDREELTYYINTVDYRLLCMTKSSLLCRDLPMPQVGVELLVALDQCVRSAWFGHVQNSSRNDFYSLRHTVVQ